MTATLDQVLAAVEELRAATKLGLTVEEAARLSGLGQGELRRLMRVGALRFVPSGASGRRRIIPRAELERVLAERLELDAHAPVGFATASQRRVA